jgi:hypothetical protein
VTCRMINTSWSWWLIQPQGGPYAIIEVKRRFASQK